MPGLVRGIARTAVIAGTASATANAVNRRQAERNVAAYSNAAQQVSAQQAPPMQAMPSDSMDDKLAQLERLAQLKAQGILSEQEFAQQKAAILG
jgi:Short C-terminal domain